MLGVGGEPPGAGAFEALLHDVAVGAFNFTRANGQVACESRLVADRRITGTRLSTSKPYLLHVMPLAG